MNRRFAKEFRPLLLPWIVVVAAGGIAPIKFLLDNPALSESLRATPALAFLFEVAAFVFFAGLALLAALSFGTEFQQRTLPLLLAQPLERSRLWAEKMLVLTCAVGTAVLIAWLSYTFLSPVIVEFLLAFVPRSSSLSGLGPATLSNRDMLFIGALLVAILCATGFWTLLTRSIIGAMALNAAALVFLLLGVDAIVERIYGADRLIVKVFVLENGALHLVEEKRGWSALLAATVIYSVLFLWLGWRKFVRIEWNDGPRSGMQSVSGFAFIRRCRAWLRCRPSGQTRNLFRKEIWLQKPVILVALVFSGCWLVTFGLWLVQPSRQPLFETIFNVLTASYVPLVVLLAGCVSLSEEKTLGLHAWQLTLPVSVRRQWLVKLATALGSALTLGLLLPYLLAWITMPGTEIGLIHVMSHPEDYWPLLTMLGLVCLLSFWAATLVGNTVHAALTTVVTVTGLVFSMSVGEWCANQFPLNVLIARLELPPSSYAKLDGETMIFVITGVMALILVGQSLVLYRRAATHHRGLWKAPAALLLAGFLLMFFFTGLTNAARQSAYQVEVELSSALRAVPLSELRETSQPPSGLKTRTLTLQELEQAGTLSERTERLLQNTSVTVWPIWSPSKRAALYSVILTFPNGRHYSFIYQAPHADGTDGTGALNPNHNTGEKQ